MAINQQPTSVSVLSYKDNPDGTTTNYLSDGSTDTGKYSQNKDGSLNFNPGGFVLNSSNLRPQTEIQYKTPTPTPVYPVTSLNFTPDMKMTKPETEAQDLTSTIRNLNERLVGESSFRAAQEQQYGISEKKKSQTDLETQLKALQNEALAIPIQLEQYASKGGMTTGQLQKQTDANLRTNAIKALTVNSLLEASRGNLATAYDMVDRAVAQQYDPLKEEIRVKKENLDLIINSPEYTVAEKNRAQQQKDIQDEKARKLEEEKTNKTEIYNIGVEAAKNGADSMVLRSIQNAKTKEEALQYGSKYLTNPLDVKEQELRIQKLRQDLAGSNLKTDVVEANGRKFLINTQTGDTIKEIGAGDNPSDVLKLARAESNISTLSSLKDSGGLTRAVGVYGISRYTPFTPDEADVQEFISGVEQIRSQLNLDTLIQAKAQGATFGALSDQELRVLANAATKIGTWAIKDEDGNVTGYKTSEKNFLNEVDKINNLAKLDFILKGGDPAAVGVAQTPDGKYWTQNSDGSYEEIKTQ